MPAPTSPVHKKALGRAEPRSISVAEAVSVRGFEFVVSPTTTHGVDVALPLRIGRLIRKLIERRGFSCELSGIVLFPIIADPKIYAQADFITHKRSENGYFV